MGLSFLVFTFEFLLIIFLQIVNNNNNMKINDNEKLKIMYNDKQAKNMKLMKHQFWLHISMIKCDKIMKIMLVTILNSV